MDVAKDASAGLLIMLSAERKLQFLTAFTTLLTLALAVGCRGFFVNPKLTSITVTPATPSLTLNQTLQMTATGNFDDGSTKNLTGSSTWTSSANTQVSVNATGLITALANTTSPVTITATNGTISGSTTATVGQTLQSISLTVSPSSTTVAAGAQLTFTATGTFSNGGGTQNITSSVTWTINPSSFIPGGISSQGVGTVSSTATSGQTFSVVASSGGINSNTLNFTIQ